MKTTKNIALALLVLTSWLGFQFALQAAPSSTYNDAPPQFGHPTQQTQDVPGASLYASSADQNVGLNELAQQQQDVIALQKAHARSAEVTVLAPVYKLLSDDLEGLQHERFLLKLTNGTTILVAHDTSYAPRVPVQQGGIVRIRGEYIWNPKGGLIHWTHMSDSPFHEGGWIDYQGKRYQ
jgi:hypothetical protein